MGLITGLHHVTAIAEDPQKCVDFYREVLGLRLVKKTVNQDDVSAYHLFFGDEDGGPGMDLTFFTFKPALPGVRGVGLADTISLAVEEGKLDFWQKRLVQHKVKFEKLGERFGRKRLVFFDHDNQKLELVEIGSAQAKKARVKPWVTPGIEPEQTIVSFYGVKLCVQAVEQIAPVLTTCFGYRDTAREGRVVQYELGVERAGVVEVEEAPDEMVGIMGAGTVHHVAFGVNSGEEQTKVRIAIKQLGLFPTEVIDRFYFKSVYFRTPAGVLFEIATSGPGFGADEDLDHLGEQLSLPPFLEHKRHEIEASLEPIK